MKQMVACRVASIGEAISMGEGINMIREYQQRFAGRRWSWQMGKRIFELILAQDGCAGVRVYNALTLSGEQTLVFVGIDEDARVMLSIVCDRTKPGGGGGIDEGMDAGWGMPEKASGMGEVIDREEGYEFIMQFQRAYSSRIQSYDIGRDILVRIFDQEGCAGLRFYNAVNGSGELTLVCSAVTDDNKQMGLLVDKIKPGGGGIDEEWGVAERVSAVGSEITPELGLQMVSAFGLRHAGRVPGYMIGRGILDRILAQERCEGICFYNALDTDGSETVVYVGIDENKKFVNGRTVIGEDGGIMKRRGIVADRIKPPPRPDTLEWGVPE